MSVQMMRAQICTYCVMDSTNPFIEFDAFGQCNACRGALFRMPHEWLRGDVGKKRLDALATLLRAEGQGRKYDGMIGLSGGVDSAFVAHLMAGERRLRLLAVHVDAGWNSAAAVGNIESIVRRLDLDLHTCVIEWADVQDLQLAFLKASVLNQDIPQDHAFFATLYRVAVKFGIRHFLSGVNFSSESVHLPNWGFPAIDGRHVAAIHRRFGTRPLDSFPIMSFGEFLWLTRIRGHLKVSKPLNFIDYNKDEARRVLTANYGWRDYGGKHHESRFTKFYETTFLPRRYGFDKRRLHFSSLIVAGQMTRDAALEELRSPIQSPLQERRDTDFVAKKLGLTREELVALIDQPSVKHETYPHHQRLMNAAATGRALWRRISGRLLARTRIDSGASRVNR
jgi:N-acetyl sugar amidotransferase